MKESIQEMIHDPFESDVRIVNLYPSKGTHWVAYITHTYFDSYGYSPPNKPSWSILKRNGSCLFSDYKLQGLTSKRDSF